MAWTDRDLFFIDTETSGLVSGYNEIIQVGCIRTDSSGEKVKDRFSAKLKLLYPERMHPKAAEVNGYKQADYTDETCTPPGEVAAKLVSFMRGAMRIGHNVPFDTGFVEAFLSEHARKPSWSYQSLDTMTLAWPLYQARLIENVKLDSVCAYFEIPRPAIHTAADDIEATRLAYIKLMARFQITH